MSEVAEPTTTPDSRPDDFPAAPPTAASAPGSIKAIVFRAALILGSAFLVFCGVIALYAVVSGYVLPQGLTEDKAEVLARASAIASIDLPPGFEPTAAFSLKLPLIGRRVFSWASFDAPSQHENADNRVIIGQFGENTAVLGVDQLSTRLDAAVLEQQNDNHIREMVDVEKDSRKKVAIKLPVETADFYFERGRGTVSDVEYIVCKGQFTSKGGVGVIIVRALADEYDEAALRRMLESISIDNRAKATAGR